MAEIVNSKFGKVFLEPGFTDNGLRQRDNIMALQTESVINFFRAFSIIKGDLVKNQFGLYSFGSFGRNRKMRFATFKGGNHLWSSRKNGCAWNPKGTFTSNLAEVETCPIETNIELCPDALWDSCWEKLMGVGNSKRDLYGTPEVAEFMGIVLDQVFRDLGDGFYDIAWFGKHPLIEQADENQTYNASSEENWMDYLDQQKTCMGFLTYVDYYKTEENLANFNVPINDGDINGADYTGNPTELFDRLDKQSTPDFKVANDSRTPYGGQPPMYLVTGAIFEAYENELIATHGALPELFYYKYNGEFCASLGCIGGDQMPGVLKYKGRPVIRMSEWDRWANMLGITQHRAMLVPPGIFGMGWDVPSLSQYSGMGLIINQKLEAPHMGKIYMHSLMEMATAITDIDFITSASKILG